MPVQPRVYRELSPHNTSLNTSSCSDRNRLRTHLHTLGHTALAAKAERCCTHFRVLACDNGHAYRPIPAERCRLRLCRNCAHWRQQRAMRRLWPAIHELSRRHPEDRWVFMTFTARASGEPLRIRVNRLTSWFAKFRRLSIWKTAICGAIAGYETTYHPGHGWHVHVHVLASRQTWVDQAALASAWQCVTGGHGTVVDIRDRDTDVRASMCRTLTSPFKPMNLAAWGPAQVAECIAPGRTKLAECYGALRGLAAG